MADLTGQGEGGFRYFYEGQWRRFFANVPDKYRLKINGRPVVFMWIGTTLWYTNPASFHTLVHDLREATKREFGIDPFIIPEESWRRLDPALVPFVVVFLFMGLFDTVGTLVGVAEQAGVLEGGKLPRANRALFVDATGITAGACLGTSTITCYIESAAGVAAGGRTGLTAVVTGLLFLLALLFGPLVRMMASYPPLTAPALVIVGAMMMQSARRVEWDDASEAVPVFLTMVGIPLSASIADGLALGFVSYPIVKLLSGRGRDVHAVAYVMSALLVVYFLAVRYRLG